MKKILFLIHDLGPGGAEKVLVNLVNNMDPAQFDITVMALFGGGVNEQFLKPHIRYRSVFPKMFPGNSHLMKLLSPEQLHKLCIREHYDIEVAYLEGPSARIISGCQDADTKLIFWIHCTMQSDTQFSGGFRSVKEAADCYSRFNHGAFVSEGVLEAFQRFCPVVHAQVLYNTNDTSQILEKAGESLSSSAFGTDGVNMVAVGKLEPVKGFDRLIRIQRHLIEDGYKTRLSILGEGTQKMELKKLAEECGVADTVTFLGYRTNPYKYVARCDLFVCASYAEGFSTAATEALIVGTPVCTAEVSGMKEMLGENNEWGIVTENDEEALYRGIKRLLDDPELLARYKEKAAQRGRCFSTENTVKAVEDMLLSL